MILIFECEVSGFKADSGVSETPLDAETKVGARNRALNSQKYDSEANMYVGIESGLEHRYGDLYEEVWVAVLYEGKEFYAYSSGILIPEVVAKALDPDVNNHPEIMQSLREKFELSVDEYGFDTWGEYTGRKVSREVGLKEALRNVFVQIFKEENSFYE